MSQEINSKTTISMAGRVLTIKHRVHKNNSKKSSKNKESTSLSGLLKRLAFAGLLPAVLRAQDEFKLTDGAEITDLDTVDGSEIIEYLKNVSADQGKLKLRQKQNVFEGTILRLFFSIFFWYV